MGAQILTALGSVLLNKDSHAKFREIRKIDIFRFLNIGVSLRVQSGDRNYA